MNPHTQSTTDEQPKQTLISKVEELTSYPQNRQNPQKSSHTHSSDDFDDFDDWGYEQEDLAFPIHALPSVIADMAVEVSRATLVPESLAVINALGILSASIGGGLLVDSGGGRETSANLYVLGIAESGTGKGSAFRMIAKPFQEAEAQDFEERKVKCNEARAELNILEKQIKKAISLASSETETLCREQATRDLAELKAREEELEDFLAMDGGFSVADVTKEKLAIAMEIQPGQALASLSAEARGVLDVLCGRYNGKGLSDEDIYLSSFSREPYKQSRISRAAVNLTTPCLAILWLIQPDAAKKMMENPTMSDSGLLPRFLMADTKADAEDEPLEAYKPKTEVLQQWSQLITELLKTVRASGDEPYIIKSTDSARRVIINFRNASNKRSKTGGDLKDIAPYPRRWGENAWRLALVLHATIHGRDASKHLLAEDTAERAVTLMKWFANQQLELLASGRTERKRARLEKLLCILGSKGGSETLRNLKKNNSFDAAEIEVLVSTFPTQLEFKEKKRGEIGRPSTIVFIPTNS